jgi:hypothetical protein
MEFEYNDGGRADAGYKGYASDCGVRAIAIITGKPYQEVYDLVNEFCKKERKSKNRDVRSSARLGIYTSTFKKIVEHLGFEWTPTMGIGTGCRVHLKASELPSGRIIVKLSHHFGAVIDGVIHDTHDPSRDETRCVYGYWKLANQP